MEVPQENLEAPCENLEAPYNNLEPPLGQLEAPLDRRKAPIPITNFVTRAFKTLRRFEPIADIEPSGWLT